LKNLYYATRLDKEGNKLTTSYTTEKMSKQYGGTQSQRSETLYMMNFEKNTVEENGPGPIVRSLLVNNGEVTQASANGKFKLYGRENSVWSQTPFAYDNYGAANAVMKALIGQYEALVIVSNGDMTDERPETKDVDLGGLM
jgi:hypothetical protein